jgi:hypothetical protein
MIFDAIDHSGHAQNSLKLLLKDSAFNSVLTYIEDFMKLEMGKFEVLFTPLLCIFSILKFETNKTDHAIGESALDSICLDMQIFAC